MKERPHHPVVVGRDPVAQVELELQPVDGRVRFAVRDRGPGIPAGAALEGMSIYDVAPTLLAWFGLAPADDMDGRALAPFAVEGSVASYDTTPIQRVSEADSALERPILDQLRSLGAEAYAELESKNTELATALTEVPAGERLPWFGPPMSPTSMATARFMETWAHARDVADALGVTLDPADRVRHVVHLGIRTRGFAFANRGLDAPADPIHVSLVLPGGDLHEDGPADAGQTVRGSAYDFALLVTQRVHRADTDLVAEGADADRWLDIAQSFAGPSGSGREPKGSA